MPKFGKNLLRIFQEKGYEVTYEKPMARSNRVDIEAVKSEEKIAIETGKSHTTSDQLRYYPFTTR